MPPTKDPQNESISDLVEKYINEHDVMIFSKSWCPYCKKVIYNFFFFILKTLLIFYC